MNDVEKRRRALESKKVLRWGGGGGEGVGEGGLVVRALGGEGGGLEK